MAKIHSFSCTIHETNLDVFGHMNNAAYLRLFEEARWELMASNNYGLQVIKASGLGPTILEITIKFLRELNARNQVRIESEVLSYHKKIGKLEQRLFRGEELCCTAVFTIGLFSLTERRLVLPTPEWLLAIGYT